MKAQSLLFFLFYLLYACNSKQNSTEFINDASGRYYFNADEIIEVYFEEKVLHLKWRGQDTKPLKVNDSTFYVKAINEKLIFLTKEHKIILANKKEHEGKEYIFNKLMKGEKTPSEHLSEGNYELALNGYLKIKKNDSLSPIIEERNLNSLGYKCIKNKNYNKAIEIFKINTVLYPKSSNTYDSLGDSYLAVKDTTKAIECFKKALSINPENRSSKRKFNKLTKIKKEHKQL
ncbi:TPR repeat-containing protein [Tenacibaculum sp. 190524A02b]|uniref:tetratricopeptide repeat protein n=1 Tax=Tenacibaculum vairaonense TaxID=3137860 RepID=UPI0032B2F6F8